MELLIETVELAELTRQIGALVQTADTITRDLIAHAEKALVEQFSFIDDVALTNQAKVLDAFREHRLTEEHFAGRTGYGLDDAGRDAIDSIFASVFGCEAAAVRMQIVSGTHAISCALFGVLRPGDRLVSVTGTPYDTMRQVIGIKGEQPGNLLEMGVLYEQTDSDPQIDSSETIKERFATILSPPTRMALIQKSCGYSLTRRTYSNDEIGLITGIIKEINPDCIVLVDNCYGEFVEAAEPSVSLQKGGSALSQEGDRALLQSGADLIAGSLIKNPGGGLALTGGYFAGRSDLVEKALCRLTAPGIGGHQGITFDQNRLVLQGLFLAPSVVASAVKGALLAAYVLEEVGLKVKPTFRERRFDIIQGIEFGKRERLVNFCRAVQRFSPVNAHVAPEPASMPGYNDEVIMAGGSFVEGATIELSCDGPLRPPFAAFLQGGLTYLHVKCMLEGAVSLSRSGELPFF